MKRKSPVQKAHADMIKDRCGANATTSATRYAKLAVENGKPVSDVKTELSRVSRMSCANVSGVKKRAKSKKKK